MTIKVHFLGAAATVTGSRFLVEVNDIKVLLECGLYQEREYQDRNYRPFPFDPSSLDAVILSHSHLDHCGLLPKLVREGYQGPIYTTQATSEIAPIVMYDTVHLQEEDLRLKAKRLAREGRTPKYPLVPLYEEEDVAKTVARFRIVPFRHQISIAPGIQAVFHEAGHILGASMVLLLLDDGELQRSVFFTGDVGRWDRPLLHDPDPFSIADYVIVEATYGDRVHPSDEIEMEEFTQIINWTYQQGGNLIIPSFAIERAQEILYRLNLLFRDHRIPPLPTYLDSPMAIKVTEVFKHHPELMNEKMQLLIHDHQSPFSFQGLHFVLSNDQSKTLNSLRGTAIIIAGSGMCTGGRIKHHLYHNLPRPESCVCFVGYQADGTLGRQILDGQNPVRIFGELREVKARIHQIHGFSAHADKHDLYRLLRSLRKEPRKVFVVHCGPNVGQRFATYLREKTDWEVMVPHYQQTVELH